MLGISIKMEKLCRDVKQYKKAAIYGTESYVEYVVERFNKKGIKTEFFIVSPQNKENLGDAAIYFLDEYVLNNREEGMIVIIAAEKDKEREIEVNLNKKNIKEFIKISDYCREYVSTAEYQNKTKKEYLDIITDWYVDSFGKQISLYPDNLVKDLEVSKDTKQIAFIIEFVKPRILKMQKILVARGYRITTIIKKSINAANGVLDEIKRNSFVSYEFQYAEEMMYYLMKSKAYLVHVFTAWGNCDLAYILINQKGLFPKIVVERYDVQNGMYLGREGYTDTEFERVLMMERFCMEHADGVCFRCFALDYLQEELGFGFLGKTLRFLDYFEDIYDDENIMADSLNDELSLCYVGGIVTEKEAPDFPEGCFLELGEQCEKNKCHLHIYPIFWNEDKWKDYIELAQISQYFHFHKPMEYTRLCKEIAQYDYGIHPSRKEMFTMKKLGQKPISDKKVLYASTNKFFDYLSAGLPIIATNPVKLIEELEDKQLVIKWSIEEYDFEELRRRKKQMKENVKKNRDYFMLGNRVQELIDFYEAI